MSERSYLISTYARSPIEFVRGEGAWMFDAAGRMWLDFLSGIAVTGFGHQHAYLSNCVKRQLNACWHVSNLFTSSSQENLARRLCQDAGLDSAFFCNSGTEANEAAIKFARKWGHGRHRIITALGSFHGRTYGSLSATGQPKFHMGFEPMLHGFDTVPFGNAAAAEDEITDETVAVMVEPIQGESGVQIPPDDYLPQLREICDAHNLLLILDEVQTGMGRTGKRFAFQHSGARPDMITLAKGIANGLPLGAVLCSAMISDVIQPGDHGSTFGGSPVSVAAALGVVDLLTDDVLSEIASKGELLGHLLHRAKHSLVVGIRQRGLMCGVQLDPLINAKSVAATALDNGLVVGTAGDHVLRVLPPFVVTDEQIRHGAEILLASISKHAEMEALA
jgi:predicted acetylornithine/succinylornithine family transaminase